MTKSEQDKVMTMTNVTRQWIQWNKMTNIRQKNKNKVRQKSQKVFFFLKTTYNKMRHKKWEMTRNKEETKKVTKQQKKLKLWHKWDAKSRSSRSRNYFKYIVLQMYS